jgi:signal transduction histidine kinase
VAVAGVYVATAKFGLSLAVAHGSATPVWAPTGIALAALVIFGPKLWPAVAIGAFLANVTTPIPVVAALGITAGNTAEALVGALLLRRVGFRYSLERVRDVVALVALGAVLSTIVSATVGVTTSLAAGTIPSSTFGQHWMIWWVGDAMGDLLVAPLLLVWVGSWSSRPRERGAEAVTLAILIGAMGTLVFADGRWLLAYLLFPLLLWATLRFRAHGATASIVVLGGIALWRILHGAGPAGTTDLIFSVEVFQALIGVVGVSLLILAATTSERVSAEVTLVLSKRVQELTKRALVREHEAVVKLEAIDDLKTTFLHAVSHDLRTPLASIYGLALTLERDDIELSPEDSRDLAHRIARNANRLHGLVGDLLDFERLDRGLLTPNRSITDVGALVRIVAQDAELDEHPLHVNADPVMVSVDRAKVERILDNLIANAVRHTPRGTNIWVQVNEQGDGVLIAVEDAGPGVPPERREEIFEAFERVDRHSNAPGVGIGLSLVTKLAELHGGRAWVQDRRGGGASFRVFLPKTGN